MTKTKMIRKIRSMQDEMGAPKVRAKTLQIEYTTEEVAEMYTQWCASFNKWSYEQV